jgi:hypothetical protein
VSIEGIPSKRLRWTSTEVDNWKTGNAIEARDSFKRFRLTIRPGMKWNWMAERVTQELQER